MSKKHVTFADLLKAKPTKEEIKPDQLKQQVDIKNDQANLKADLNQNAQSSTMQPSIIETTDHRTVVSMIPQTIDTTDHRYYRPMISENNVKGYFLPNWIQDELLPTLDITEQIVLLRIVRLTLGSNQQLTDSISLNKLSQKCNLSVPAIQRAIKSLQQKQLLIVHSDLSRNNQGGNKYELGQGFIETINHRNESS